MPASKYTKSHSDAIEKSAFGNWLSGFTDGEGCFTLECGLSKRSGIPVLGACFSINLRDDDIKILHCINSYFGCGNIRGIKNRTNHPTAAYRVRKPIDLASIIVPHFNTFPLRAKKSRDFEVWKKGVKLLCVVSSRPGTGSKPKWQSNEIDDFVELIDVLRLTREYVKNETTGVSNNHHS